MGLAISMISLAFTIARGGSCSAFHYLMNPTFHNKCKCPWAGQEKHVPKLLPTTFSKSHLALPRAKGENSMLGSMPLAASFLSEVKCISLQLHISGHQRFNVERSKLYQAISHPSRNMSPMPLQRLSDCPPSLQSHLFRLWRPQNPQLQPQPCLARVRSGIPHFNPDQQGGFLAAQGSLETNPARQAPAKMRGNASRYPPICDHFK
jgi:hypothetical protein